jgi:hypothetical protein
VESRDGQNDYIRCLYKAKKWLIMSTRQELVLVSHYWSPAGKGVRRDAFKQTQFPDVADEATE